MFEERDTDVEGELSGEVVHAAGVHQAQRVPHRLGAQHALTRDRAYAAVSQGGCHDTGALAGHLDGAQLEGHTKDIWCEFSLVAVVENKGAGMRNSSVQTEGENGSTVVAEILV